MYQVKTEIYAGPIEKLLELIEARELDITLVSLSEVTADFLSYVRALPQIDTRLLSDFLVVAARLVLIKSKILLPTLPLSEEDEGDIRDLEIRLELYKQFKGASKHVLTLWENDAKCFSRELFSFSDVRVFYPSTNLTKETLLTATKNLIRVLERFTDRHTDIIKRTVVTIETKIQELINFFNKEKGASRLSELSKNKEETIVLFLAILHLIKDRLLHVEQKEQFSDIIVRSK